jgi:putative ABC transport system permease protein
VTLASVVAKNLLRNKARAVLTVLGVAVAILTFVMLRTMVWSWTMGAEVAAKDRVVTRHKMTFVMSLPRRYTETVKAVPGVKGITFANWFGGRDPKHEHEFFATLAVDPKTYFDVFDEASVPPDQKATWMSDRKGAIVGDVLAKKMGWKIGDKVMLTSGIYGGDWEFQIDGIYTALRKSIDRSTFLFQWEYMNEQGPLRMKDQVGWIVSRIDDPARAADISVAIDRAFDDREIQTLSQDERSFNTSFIAMMSAVLKAVDVVSLAILVIMMLILGNTIAMGVRERTNEYGVLRAIGFLPRHIAAFILGEGILVGAIGGGVGLLISYPIVERGMGRWIEENLGSFIPYFRIAPVTAATAIGLAIGIAAVASILPALRASRLSVVDALRRVG